MAFRKITTGLVLASCLLAGHTRAEPFPSTYQALPSEPVLIRNAVILSGTGTRIDNGSLLIKDGKIAFIGDTSPEIDQNTAVIDAEGRWITPGLIDVHSHLGVYASPGVKAHSDGNESTAPVTADRLEENELFLQRPGELLLVGVISTELTESPHPICQFGCSPLLAAEGIHPVIGYRLEVGQRVLQRFFETGRIELVGEIGPGTRWHDPKSLFRR